MIIKALTVLVMLVGFYSCRAQQQSNTDNGGALFSIQKATFTRWHGGQRGVGGVIYDISVRCSVDLDELQVTKFSVDGAELHIDRIFKDGDLITIRSINTQMVAPIILGDTIQRTRNLNLVPETGEIVINLGGIFHLLPIETFVEQKSTRPRIK